MTGMRLLDAHDAVVRAQLARFRGREVNTSGDGFLAMFDGPQRAIRCAMAIRDAVQALGIEVRAGLHTGECEVRGDDIGGIAVHIGARVSALAGPNDVLVSSTLRDLVIGSGLEFEERGAHQLKGVPGEWHLFAVASSSGRCGETHSPDLVRAVDQEVQAGYRDACTCSISRQRSVLLGPGRFGRMRRSPSRRWSSSHPCGRAIRRSGRREHRAGGRSRC